MHLKSSAISACAAMLLSSCGDKPEAKAVATEAPPQQLALDVINSDRRDPRAYQKLTRTLAAVSQISKLQEESFSRRGYWLDQADVDRYESLLITSVAKDLGLTVFENSPESFQKLILQLNQANFHIYISQMSVADLPYFNVTIFSLGEPHSSVELEEVKKSMGLAQHNIKMRELVEVFATQKSESLYGSVSADGNILIAPWTIADDKFAAARDPVVMFKVVIANELAHLKLAEVRNQGRLTNTTHELEEAYSDYWTLATTPAEEIVFGLFDVLASTTLRYAESQKFAKQALEVYGKKYVQGFSLLSDHQSLDGLLLKITESLTPESADLLKAELLQVYKKNLRMQGYQEDLF